MSHIKLQLLGQGLSKPTEKNNHNPQVMEAISSPVERRWIWEEENTNREEFITHIVSEYVNAAHETTNMIYEFHTYTIILCVQVYEGATFDRNKNKYLQTIGRHVSLKISKGEIVLFDDIILNKKQLKDMLQKYIV